MTNTVHINGVFEKRNGSRDQLEKDPGIDPRIFDYAFD